MRKNNQKNWNSVEPVPLDLDPVTGKSMRQRYRAICIAEKSVNHIRSVQLQKIANLFDVSDHAKNSLGSFTNAATEYCTYCLTPMQG